MKHENITQLISECERWSEMTCPDPLLEAKKNGKRVIGYFCSYIPVEILYAAGCVPYRMRAVESAGATQGDAYYSPLNCSFVRRCFGKALRGDFSFLDGVIFMNGCDHVRRMYDLWRFTKISPSFLYMFIVPHIIQGNALLEYTNNIRMLISSIEAQTGVSIQKTDLTHAIQLYNHKRRLLQSLNQIRQQESVQLTGTDMLSIVKAVSAIPIDIAIDRLEQIHDAIGQRPLQTKPSVRLFLAGGCLEEIEHMRLIEQEGVRVVSDNLCFGTREYDKQIDESGDPIEALAYGYLHQVSCPRMMDDVTRRTEWFTDQMQQSYIHGIIIEKIKFCDLWAWEIFRMNRLAESLSMPFLSIERELYGGSTGQIRTRIQAFLEQIKNTK
ncbi:MAG: 2-hydroxyacyl-CoA dehydratase [Desulfobacterales bacterium]|nr:2-hydroxyacyl-CoA dehydratase [Desulfobacterales bacterium]